MSTRLSLAEQIAKLTQGPAPEFDADDFQTAHSPSQEFRHEDNITAREHYLDVGSSSLRRDDLIVDPKYSHEDVTRSRLTEDNTVPVTTHEPESGDDSEPDGGPPHSARPAAPPQPARNIQISSGQRSAMPAAALRDRDSSAEDDVPRSRDLATSVREHRGGECRKGKAITHQMTIWNALVDARIQLQKAVSATDSLPSSLRSSQSAPTTYDLVQSVFLEASRLSHELLVLQSSLDGADALDITSVHDQEPIDDIEDGLRSLFAAASKVETAYEPHLVQILSKWSSRIQLSIPSLSLTKESFSLKNSLGRSSGLVDVIQEILDADGEGLLARTRTAASGDVSMEVFSDTDFYQQLLHDIIESKAAAFATEKELDWAKHQRKAKHTRAVDTKASKGRKLRYDVHEKLQHFMTPVPIVLGSWPDEQIDQLFSSLVVN